MSLHIVLDHSALIPCGTKPDEEKKAIRVLGDLLPRYDVVWYVSERYLCILKSKLEEITRHKPLPKLQSALTRILYDLIKHAWSRKSQRAPTPLYKLMSPRRSESLEDEFKLKLRVVARSALKYVGDKEPELKRKLEELKERSKKRKSKDKEGLGDDDLEVLAIAIASRSYANPIYVVTTDTLLLDAVTQIVQQAELNIVAKTPRQLVQEMLGETGTEPTDA